MLSQGTKTLWSMLGQWKIGLPSFQLRTVIRTKKKKTAGLEIKRPDPLPVNEDIEYPVLRVVFPDGSSQVMPRREAFGAALQLGLDLVLVGPPPVNPPVAKLANYGKLMYQRTQKAKEKSKLARYQSKLSTPKEVRITVASQPHDVNIRLAAARRFLDEGRDVRLTIFFRKRTREEAQEKLDEVLRSLRDEIVIRDQKQEIVTNKLSLVVGPKK